MEGTGTDNVTADAADNSKTTLYVRKVGGTSAEATLSCLVIGYVVNFTSPAPGTEFIVGIATSVTITSTIDDNYEFSFDSDFSNIRGTVTVVGGTGTDNVTADVGDVGKTTLYVREVGGTSAHATLACSVGIGIIITIISPASGTQFLVGGTTVVSGASTGLEGEIVEASFDGFVTIVGTSGIIPAGGAWSLNATALSGDIGETDLEVREVGGSTALDTITCTVADLPQLFTTTAVLLDYQAELAIHAGASFTYVDDAITGLAADRLVIKTGAPEWNATDALFNGHASVTHTSDTIGANTPGIGTTQNQPYAILMVCTVPTVIGTRNQLLDGYDAAHRCALIVRSLPQWECETGILTLMGVVPDFTQPALILFEIDSAGTATRIRTMAADGTEQTGNGKASGLDNFGGLFIGGDYTGGNLTNVSWHRSLVLGAVPTASEWTSIKAWALEILNWGP